MNRPASSDESTILSWLNGLPDVLFTVTLYLIRWAIVLPLSLLLSPVATSADRAQTAGDPLLSLAGFLIFAPVLETLIECALPYWIMRRIFGWSRRSFMPFVLVSACVMVILHPLSHIVSTFAFITGSFLAYVYAHFAPGSQWKAFVHTAAFHAAINAVGWMMIFAR
jgi:hypothetical protein